MSLIIFLSALVLLSGSSCKGKTSASPDASDIAETLIQSAETFTITASDSSLGTSQNQGGSNPSAGTSGTSESTGEPSASNSTPTTDSTQPTPSPTPVSPFSNFSFDLSGDQTSLYARNLHITSGSNQTVFYGKDTILSTPGNPLSRNAPFGEYGYNEETFNGEQYSIDGNCIAVIIDWDDYSAGRLVYCDGKSVINIAEQVDSFCLSSDGSHLAYLTGKYDHGVGGNLYLYDCQTKETTFIASGAGRLFVLSPTGNSIAYTQFYRKNDPDTLVCYVKTGLEAAELVGVERYCIALTDDAQTVYCVKQSNSGYELYVYIDLKENRLTDSIFYQKYSGYYYTEYSGPTFCFNNDCTQMVYSDSESTWLYVSGEEPIQVFDSGNAVLTGKTSMTGFIPNNLFSAFYQERMIRDYARCACATSFSGTKNLCNVVFRTDLVIGFFDEYLLPHKFLNTGYFYALQDESNSFIFSSDNNMKIYTPANWAEPVKLKADDYLGKTSDGRTFYVRDSYLFSMNEAGEEEKLVELNGYAVPYFSPDLSKIFVMDAYEWGDYSESLDPRDSDFFGSLYVIDTDKPSELQLIADLVPQKTFMVNGRDITYSKYVKSDNEVYDVWWFFSVDVKQYYSCDGDDFKYISTHAETFEIMGG
jgi:hypothetical protein